MADELPDAYLQEVFYVVARLAENDSAFIVRTVGLLNRRRITIERAGE